MRTRVRSNRVCALLLLPASLPGAHAAEWSFQPALDWRVDHHSNRRLSVESDPGEGAWLTLSAAFRHATDRSELTVRPQATAQRFANQSQLDAEEGALGLSGTWLGEYSQLKGSANIADTSTLTSELDRTGIVEARARREERSATLMWNRRLTPVWSFNTQFGYQDIDYPGGLRFGLIGYRYPNAAVGLTAQVSASVAVTATAFGGELTAPLTRTESRNTGGRVGLQWALSKTTQASFSGGVNLTDIENPFGSRHDDGQVWSAGWTRTGELHRWNLSWSRNAAASGRGVLSRHEELAAGVARDFSAQLSATLSLRGVRNADVVPGLREERYRYTAVEAGLARRLSPDWALNLDAGVRQARWEETGRRAEGWFGRIGLRWTPAVRAIAR